jgi:hypothetical protein
VSKYEAAEYEEMTIGEKQLKVYPCWYPVGQGYRNIDKAKQRIQAILSKGC